MIRKIIFYTFYIWTRSKNTSLKMVEPIFRDISADDDKPEVTELESLCLACHENVSLLILSTECFI